MSLHLIHTVESCPPGVKLSPNVAERQSSSFFGSSYGCLPVSDTFGQAIVGMHRAKMARILVQHSIFQFCCQISLNVVHLKTQQDSCRRQRPDFQLQAV